MNNTKIDYVSFSWNPVSGCSKASEGCDHCFAERFSSRLKGRSGYDRDTPFKPTIHPSKLIDPLKIKKPQVILVPTMGDLFHRDIPFTYVDAVFGVMAIASQHTFLVLTKRPSHVLEWFDRIDRRKHPNQFIHSLNMYRDRIFEDPNKNNEPILDKTIDSLSRGYPWPLPNVWFGVSCENQYRADERIPILRKIPAVKKFVSLEPLLGNIYLESIMIESDISEFNGFDFIDWVIVGGEKGHGARPMRASWVENIREQCAENKIPYFFKQWGTGRKVGLEDRHVPEM